MARTETDVYRRFDGELRSRPLRFLPITLADFRIATRKKLPLLIFFGPPAIATIVFSFLVYLKFSAEALSQAPDFDRRAAMAASLAGQLIEVRQQIVEFTRSMQMFALLAITWYGAGLIAEDRRLGAHLLYFSRPLTRLDYFLAKFLTAASFGAFAVLVPGVVICTVAAFSSPEWSFVKEEGEVLWMTPLYTGLWIVVITSIVLAVSSLVKRKNYALAGVFALFMLNGAAAGILSEALGQNGLRRISLVEDFLRIGEWMYELPTRGRDWSVESAFAVVIGTLLLALAVIALRLRKLEVVA